MMNIFLKLFEKEKIALKNPKPLLSYSTLTSGLKWQRLQISRRTVFSCFVLYGSCWIASCHTIASHMRSGRGGGSNFTETHKRTTWGGRRKIPCIRERKMWTIAMFKREIFHRQFLSYPEIVVEFCFGCCQCWFDGFHFE